MQKQRIIISITELNCGAYDAVAQQSTVVMHRYCINELWKFVKSLVKAFSVMRFDERNQTAHDEASSVQYYMEGL